MTDRVPSDDRWRKSALSGNADCVEVAIGSHDVWVRDSKHPDGPVLAFTAFDWASFVRNVRRNR